MGKLEGENTMTDQAYRYPKDTWEAAEARSHCKDHDGSFEAASEEGFDCDYTKAGRALSKANEGRILDARDNCDEIVGTDDLPRAVTALAKDSVQKLDEVLASVQAQDDEERSFEIVDTHTTLGDVCHWAAHASDHDLKQAKQMVDSALETNRKDRNRRWFDRLLSRN